MIGVRRATAADVDVLVDLMREFYAEAGFPLDEAWAASAFARLLDDSSLGAAWIMSVDGEAAGHAVLTVRFAMEFGGLSGYIDDLFVRTHHRRRGAAQAGLEALVADAAREAASRFTSKSIPGTARRWRCISDLASNLVTTHART